MMVCWSIRSYRAAVCAGAGAWPAVPGEAAAAARAPAALIGHEPMKQDGPPKRRHKHELEQPPSQADGNGEDERLLVERVEEPERRGEQAEQLLQHGEELYGEEGERGRSHTYTCTHTTCLCCLVRVSSRSQ